MRSCAQQEQCRVAQPRLFTCNDGCRLEGAQRLLSTGDKQSTGGSTLSECPEDTLQDWGVWVAIGSDAVDDQGARVGGGDEIQNDGSDGQGAVEVTSLVLIPHVEVLALDGLLRQKPDRFQQLC